MTHDNEIDPLQHALHLANDGVSSAVFTVLRGDRVGNKVLVTATEIVGSLGDDELDAAASKIARERLENGPSGLVSLTGTTDAFIDIHRPPPLMVMIGADHVAQVLVGLASILGYRTVVADAREMLANRDRFPTVDQLMIAWPDDALAKLPINSSSVIIILTHDPKFDDPALTAALATNAGYVGAIGSRKTSGEKLERLEKAGVSIDQIQRIHAPIGLDIGGRTPQEMAISILAEIIAVRSGRAGGSLRNASGPIRADG